MESENNDECVLWFINHAAAEISRWGEATATSIGISGFRRNVRNKQLMQRGMEGGGVSKYVLHKEEWGHKNLNLKLARLNSFSEFAQRHRSTY